MSMPLKKEILQKRHMSEPLLQMSRLGERSRLATNDKQIITVRDFENSFDILNLFLGGNNVKIFDYINNCYYFKTITAQKQIDASMSGINALVSFIKTKFYKDELVLKKDVRMRITPEFINEAVISSIMTREYFTTDRPSFCLGRMFAAFSCLDRGYMIFEKYLGPLHKFPLIFVDQRLVAYVIIQVLTTMKILQNKYHFTHYDLHTGNILVYQLSDKDVFQGKPLHGSTASFFFNGFEFVFENIGFIVKIIDFGISRLETNEQTLVTHHKYNQFSPFYDLAFFIHSLYLELGFVAQKYKVPPLLFKMLAFIDVTEKLSKEGRPMMFESLNYDWYLDKLCKDILKILHSPSKITNMDRDHAEIIVS